MQLKTLAFYLFAFLSLSSCTKSGSSANNGGNNNGGGNPPPNFLLHAVYSEGHDASGKLTYGISDIYNYDKPNNTVTVYENDTITGAFADTILCKLLNDSITITHKGALLIQTYYLNKSHTQIDSSILINGNTTIINRNNYTLNNDGNLLTKKTTTVIYTNGVPGTPTDLITNYTWSNGNLIKSSNSNLIFNYIYDEKKLASQPDPLLIIYDPDSYLNFSRNIIQTLSFTYTAGITDNSSFEYDDKGRIATLSGNDSNGETNSATYTYY